MLNYSELTIVNNSEGMPTALGYPVNSILLQVNRPLFVGGGKIKRGKKRNDKENKDDNDNEEIDFEQLAVPAGLICTTQTICRTPDVYDNSNAYDNRPEPETIPEGLYEQLLALAESKPAKKMSRRNHKSPKHTKKNKTKRYNK